MLHRLALALFTAALLVIASGCATIVKGRSTDVTIDSERGFGEWGFVGGYRLEDLIYDFNAEGNDPIVEDGATFNAITGVHSYSFNRYKIMPRSAEDFE